MDEMWDLHLRGEQAGLVKGRGGYDPARPSLLMVHGSGGCGAGFLPQLSGLGEHVNVVAIDLPGHGGTPGPGLESIDAYAAWLGDFLEAGPVRPVLLGHSLGGAVVMTLALTRPHLMRGLILAGTGSRLRVLPAILEGVLADFAPTARLVVQTAYAPGADPRLVEQGVHIMQQVEPRVLWGDFTACDRFDIGERLKEITHPTLVLVGENDRLTPPKYSQRLAEAIAGSRLVVLPGAGHMAHVERHREFNQAVLEFMAER
jgi:pimeloyl-ACP methyl ester carboxylesterase